jgi:hypothetical protein
MSRYNLLAVCFIFAVVVIVKLGCQQRGKSAPSKHSVTTTSSPPAPKKQPLTEAAKTENILKPGEYNVLVMLETISPRAIELTKKLKISLLDLAKSKPGEQLPYNPNCGLTEAEYKELLNLYMNTGSRVDYVDKLIIQQNDDQTIHLKASASLPELDGIKFDFKKNQVTTSFGNLTAADDINAPASSPLGAWKGKRWAQESTSLADGLVVESISIGQHLETGRGVLYYRLKQVGLSGKQSISRILMFDLQ